ncbi:MAG: radical SAM protein [Candidatus Omnitrophica bacterium]|nr:radical SAM protein [Candidatus Omnitrophota bacterium]
MWRLKTGGEHKRGKYYLRKDGFSAPPITIAIRLTYQCNLRCLACGQWGEHGTFIRSSPETLPKDGLGLKEMEGLIKEVAPFRPFIYFTGGEPLLRRDIFEVIRCLSAHHLITSMTSNATRLSECAGDVVDSGLDYFYCSLDAPDQLNDVIRPGEPGAFEKTLDGLKALLEARRQKGGLPLVQVQTVIVKENQDRLYEMARFLDQHICPDVWGLQLKVFTTPEVYKRAEEVFKKEFGVTPLYWKGFMQENTNGFDYKVLAEELRRIKAKRWGFKLRLYSPLDLPDFNARTYFEEPQKLFVDGPCMYPWAFAQIQPDGGVAICGSQPDVIIGNIKEESFMDIWNGERAIKFRHYIQKDNLPVCSRCFGLHGFSGYK